MVTGDWVNYIGDCRSMETIMESTGLERDCTSTPNGTYFLGRRRHLVPNVYFVAAVIIYRCILAKAAADAKLINQMAIPSGFIELYC